MNTNQTISHQASSEQRSQSATVGSQLIERIAIAKYIATPAMAEEIGWQHALADLSKERTSGTYLSVLVAMAQAHIKAHRGMPSATAVDIVHAEALYPHILDGLRKAGVPDTELQRRGTFARTSKATLIAWLSDPGNDLRKLKPATVTKSALNRRNDSDAAAMSGSRTERAIQKSTEVILRALDRIYKKDPDQGIATIDRIIDELQAHRDALAELESTVGDSPEVISSRLHRRNVPSGTSRARAVLHSHAATA